MVEEAGEKTLLDVETRLLGQKNDDLIDAVQTGSLVDVKRSALSLPQHVPSCVRMCACAAGNALLPWRYPDYLPHTTSFSRFSLRPAFVLVLSPLTLFTFLHPSLISLSPSPKKTAGNQGATRRGRKRKRL